MAVVRRSSPPYALIIFIFLWAVSTGLAVFFYVKWTGTDAEARKVSGPADAAAIRSLSTGAGNATVVASAQKKITDLESRIGNLKLEINGSDSRDSEAMRDAVRKEIQTLLTSDAALDKTKDGSLKSIIITAKGELDNLRSQLAQQVQEVQNLTKQYNDAQSNFQRQLASKNDTIKELTDQANRQGADAKSARDNVDAATKKYEDQIAAMKTDFEAQQRERVKEIDALKQEMAKKDNRVNSLMAQIRELRPANRTNAGREVDGQIVRVSTGSKEVFINLGRKDRIVPGLTFAVYDPKLGVRINDDNEAKGKGGIEVLEVGEVESLCRVTHVEKGVSLQNGDLIANPVYHTDKTRKFRFVIYGNFDLDGDGIATTNERDRLARMVSAWGGIVEEPIEATEGDKKITTISSQVDFVVVGTRPSGPPPQADMTEGSAGWSAQQAQKAYDDIVVEAKRASVPLLNANRFLSIIGYYNTTVVRY